MRMPTFISTQFSTTRDVLISPHRYSQLARNYTLLGALFFALIWFTLCASIQSGVFATRMVPKLKAKLDQAHTEAITHYPDDLVIEFADSQLSFSSDPFRIERPEWLGEQLPPILFYFSSDEQNQVDSRVFFNASTQSGKINYEDSEQTVVWSELFEEDVAFTITSENVEQESSAFIEMLHAFLDKLPMIALTLSWIVLTPLLVVMTIVEILFFVVVYLFLPGREKNIRSIIKMGLFLSCFGLSVATLIFVLYPSTPLFTSTWFTLSFWAAGFLVILIERNKNGDYSS